MSDILKVSLLGRDYLLRSQGEPDQVQEAAALVEAKLAGLAAAQTADTRDRYVLALLNLAGDFLQERRRSKALADQLQRLQDRSTQDAVQLDMFGTKIIERIENALDS